MECGLGCRMATAVDSPASSPLGSRTQPARDRGDLRPGAFQFAGSPPSPQAWTAGAAQPQANAFAGTYFGAAGMTPGKPAAQTPRRAQKAKVRSPVAPQPTAPGTSFAFGTAGSTVPPGASSTGAQQPSPRPHGSATGAEDIRSLPMRFAQTVHLGPKDWPPSAQKPAPSGVHTTASGSMTMLIMHID